MLVLAILIFHVNFMDYSCASSDGDWGKRYKMGNPCSAAAQMATSSSNNPGTCPKAILAKLKLPGIETNLALGQIENTTVNSTQQSSGLIEDEVLPCPLLQQREPFAQVHGDQRRGIQ